MKHKFWLWIALAFVCTAFSARANAQNFKCESNDGHLRQCSVPAQGRVVLVRQISGSPCIEGRTWGQRNASTVWVDAGCRAEFSLQNNGYYGNGGYGNGGYGNGQVYGNNGQYGQYGSGQTFRCSSDDERRHVCRVDTSYGVQLVRQVSGSPCIQGQTWGYTNDGVWVDRGCRADFQTGSYANNGGYYPGQGGYGNGGYGGYGNNNGYGRQTVYCASDDGGRHYCAANNSGNMRRVRLVNQRSGSPCIEGQTWGYDNRGIWVDRGCRAEFSVGGGRHRGNDRWGNNGNWRDRDGDNDRDDNDYWQRSRRDRDHDHDRDRDHSWGY